MMLSGVLLLAALAFAAPPPQAVIPERFCTGLPSADPELRSWVARIDPELGRGPVHVLPEDAALALFTRAADAGWSSVELFTRDAFREPCTPYLSQDVLQAIDERFRLDLLTVVRGEDQRERDFAMHAMLGGWGRLVAPYDRDDIVYWNPREERDFGLSSRVRLATPGRGRLEDVEGLCAEVSLLGCVDIDSLVKDGDTITVEAGPFRTETQATPIEPKRATLARE